MSSPNRALVRLVAALGVTAGALVTSLAALIAVSEQTTLGGIRRHWCLTVPASLFDRALHSATFGVWLLLAVPLLAAVWTANRERAIGAELRAATRAARLEPVPVDAAAIAVVVGVADALDVVDAPHPFAFVYGWRRPRICVSTGLIGRLSDRELEAVLRHERWHLVRRDPVRLLLVRMLSAAFLFVPGIRQLSRQYRLATEIAADRHAVEAMGSRRWLLSALMKLVRTVPPVGVAAFVGSADVRIAALAGEPLTEVGLPRRTAVLGLLGELAIVVVLAQSGRGWSPGAWLNLFC